jgi:hypothetical protein
MGAIESMLGRPAVMLLIRRVRTEAQSQSWKKYHRALRDLVFAARTHPPHTEAICLAFSNFSSIARLAAPVFIRSG